MPIQFSWPTSQKVCIEMDNAQQAGRGEGVEWRGQEWSGGDGSGVEGRGGEGRGGQGRAGQGARLLRWTFTGRDFIPLNTPVERAAT